MVYRIYVEKKPEFANEAAELKYSAKTLLGIEKLQSVRVINRFDAENISEELFNECVRSVFAEPQLDNTATNLQMLPFENVKPEDVIKYAAAVFAAETLPGSREQIIDYAEQYIGMVAPDVKPVIKCAKVYVLYGELTQEEIDAVKNFLIDSTVMRETSLETPESLVEQETEAELRSEDKTEAKTPEDIKTLSGFITMNEAMYTGCIQKMELGMDEADLALCVEYFRDTEERDPTMTELKVIDTYWADRSRNAAFNAVIDSVTFEDQLLEDVYKDYLMLRKDLGRDKPVTLKDIAEIAVRHLKRMGRLDKLDENEKNSACTVMINVTVDGEKEPWLLSFSNGSQPAGADPYETGAASLGGCIRDVISGRAYAYSAMRLTGAPDPTQIESGSTPDLKKNACAEGAEGFSVYSDKVGICTGLVDEIYHPGYAAGRLEASAVLAAVPSVCVRTEDPEPGDIVMLLGGSFDSAIDERKIRKLLRNGVATRMMKRCSSLGAGGIGVMAGVLADGLEIDLDAIPAAAGDLDGTDLALGASREKAACVIDEENEKLFHLMAAEHNLKCIRIAKVTKEPRLVLKWRGKKIADISGEFLNSMGAEKHVDIAPAVPGDWKATSKYRAARNFKAAMSNIAQDINVCSRKGLSGRFDSTVGTGTVLMPAGGHAQLTPVQAMVQKIPLSKGNTDDCSMMAWGYNPFVSTASPYHGGYLAVVESVAKLIATGASYSDIYLAFQEYFGAPGDDAAAWGKPFAALLGAFEAQIGLGIGAIKHSGAMDGSFEGIDVPPTLISFALTMGTTEKTVTPEFKEADHKVIIMRPQIEKDDNGVGKGLPNPESLITIWKKANSLLESGDAVAAYTPGIGGIAEAIMKMCFGNGLGFKYNLDEEEAKRIGSRYKTAALEELFGYCYGSIILELNEDVEVRSRVADIVTLGYTTEKQSIRCIEEEISLADLLNLYENRLESVYPVSCGSEEEISNISYKARSYHTPIFKRSEPKVLIPVFPGTTCESDSAKAMSEAGASPDILRIGFGTPDEIKRSAEKFASALKDTQMVYIPGGPSYSADPGSTDGYIAAFLRNEAVTEAIMELLEKKDGLMCGIGSGFQALLKLGLVPYGRIAEEGEEIPALTYNTTGHLQSGIARIRIASNKSPWLRYAEVGEVYSVPVSFTRGRFIASEELVRHLAGAGQIATQYADLEGNASSDTRFNLAGSMMAVEGITSPDGRVFGQMGHFERTGVGLYKNVPGDYFVGMFENAVRYFK